MLVQEFTPQTDVRAYTWNGQTYDLTGDLVSWTRTKSQNAGSFTLNFVPRSNWSKILKPMTYIEIRASKSGQKVNGKLPIIMRGFVDFPGSNTQMGQTGVSEPRAPVSGTDFTKVFLAWQILYLFTQNMFTPSGSKQFQRIAAQNAGFGMFANYRIPIFSPSINAFMLAAFNNIVNPVLKGLREKNYPYFPEMTHDFRYPALAMNNMPVASYTGSLWNLFEYAASPPFGEFFVRDEESGPLVIGRMTPYKTVSGAIPKFGLDIGSAGRIEGIQGITVQQSDQDLYTYFLTWAADAQLYNMTMPTFLPGYSNGVMTDKASLYGINPLQIDTPWISLSQSNGKNDSAVKLASELNAWLVAVMGDAELFWNGTINCHGDETLQIGTYRTAFNPDANANQEFYVSQISDSFEYTANQWTANVQVVRGRDLA